MKLLPKQQLQVEIATQRKAQIDEGIQIASKIDLLRVTLANLEKQHSEFVIKSKQELTEQTSELYSRIAALKNEILHLEEQKKELLKPLDEQWAQLYDREKQLSQSLTNLSLSIYEQHEKEKRIEEREKQIEKIRSDTEEANKEANKQRRKTRELLEQSKITSAAITQKQEMSDRAIKEREADLEVREQRNEFNRKGIENYKQILERKEQDLIIREKHLASQQESLKIAMQEIRKHANNRSI